VVVRTIITYAATIWWPRVTFQWKPKQEGFGHAFMIQDMKKKPISQMGSDKMIPGHVYENPS
jgi:hypothetical protein